MIKCTHVASKILSETQRIEVWDAKKLCVHPFKFSYLCDAGIMQRPHPPETDKFPRISVDDPVCRYLGAKIGDVVWSDIIWGALGKGRRNRIVIP
jgi:hypothetical protein